MLGLSRTSAALLLPAPSREAGGYVICGFTAADAADIPRAFTEVYGRDYLSPLVYDPAAFAALVAGGNQISFVARDGAGDFAGHLALAFSAPNRSLVEVSQGIVRPAHRKSGIFARLMERAVDFARHEIGAQAVFGTALTNHAVSQRVLATCGFRDVGLEVDYVPARMLVREGAGGPAATLVQYLDLGRHEAPPCHLPPSYAAWFVRLLEGAGIAGRQQVTLATGLDRRASLGETKDMPRFDMARLLVRRPGFDFWSLVAAQESEAESSGRRIFQVLISLGSAEGAAAVELLRGWGYASGGLLPGYLRGGHHAAIMYRSFQQPYFEGVKLHCESAERLLSDIVADWQHAERLGAELRHAFRDEPADDELAGTVLPAPPLPERADAASLDTTLQMLGLGGRVTLANGGMAPVEFGSAGQEDDAAAGREPGADADHATL